MRTAAWGMVAVLAMTMPALASPQTDLAKAEQQYNATYATQDAAKILAAAKSVYELQVKVTGKDSLEAHRKQQDLAKAYLAAGQLSAAEKLFVEIVARASKGKVQFSSELAEPLQDLASIYEAQLRPADVDNAWQRILDITKKLDGEQSADYARRLQLYGYTLEARSEYSTALRTFEQVLKIYEALPAAKTDGSLVAAHQNLGTLLLRMNQITRASAELDKAAELNAQSPLATPLSKATAEWGFGLEYMMYGRKDLADKQFDKAIATCKAQIAAIEKRAPADPQLADLYTSLGVMYVYRLDAANAEPAYTKALALQKKAHVPTYGTEAALGELRRLQGKPKEGLALYEKVREQYAKQIGSARVPNNYDLMVAQVKRDLGDAKGAAQAIEKYASDIAASYGKRGTPYTYPLFMAVEMNASAGNVKKAEAQLGEALDTEEKSLVNALRFGTDADHAAYAAQNRDALDLAISFNVTFGKAPSATRLALTTLLRRKGRILDAAAGTMATIRRKLSPADQQLLDELNATRGRLAKLSVAGGSDPAVARQVAELEAAIQRLEGEISKKSAAYKQATQAVDLAAIQKLIPKDARLVEIANYEPRYPVRSYQERSTKPHLPRRYAAYVVGPTGDPVIVELGDALAIEDAIAKFRKALADPDNDQASELGKQLDALTMAKIRPKLGSATNVLIAPDGALNVIPFSALVDEKGQFLIKRYTFTYLTSGRDLLRLAVKTKSQGGGVMFADPKFDSTGPKGTSRGRRAAALSSFTWPQLPGTAAEATAVTKTFKGMKLFRGEQATEGAVKALQGPQILHLATHGFFLPDEHPPDASAAAAAAGPPENPLLRSGLALSGANKLSSGDDDGLLTALEASGLDLEGTKLVVLSACETGVGKVTNGDGVYGLRRSLVIAGAQSLVMSLWQVDDFATKELMTGFYKGLTDGKARSAALRDAQIKLLSNSKYAHPFYWAAFVPAGATTPLKE